MDFYKDVIVKTMTFLGSLAIAELMFFQKQVALEEQPKKTVKVTLHPKFDHCPASKV